MSPHLRLSEASLPDYLKGLGLASPGETASAETAAESPRAPLVFPATTPPTEALWGLTLRLRKGTDQEAGSQQHSCQVGSQPVGTDT